MIRAFIQARMGSSRFPGKVLAPFKGRPLIAHVIERAGRALPRDHIVVATSDQAADDPLAGYVGSLEVAVHRGPLQDVFARYRGCLERYPCRWFFRLCADSPLLDPAVMTAMTAFADRADLDLVTNVHPRTFPRGQSAELVLASTFSSIEPRGLTDDQREHVTKVYYDRAPKFRIFNLTSGDADLARTNLCVDSLEDLRRLEGSGGRG